MIEVVDDYEAGRPVPVPDAVSAPYFAGCARGEFLLQRSPGGQFQFYPRPHSVDGTGDPEWVPASGRGTVHTFTVIRQIGLPFFKDQAPYVVAMIDLEEGPRVMGNVTGVDVDDVRIGMPVEVYVRRAGDDVAVPFWRPAGGAPEREPGA